MAQPSAAREPSMEEILASIRRIIESNEPANLKQDFPSDDADEDRADEPAAEAPVADLRMMPESPAPRQFVAANTAGPVAPAPMPAAAEPRAVSLADVAARVRAASERQASAVSPMQDRPVMTPARTETVSAETAAEPVVRAVELRGSTAAKPVLREPVSVAPSAPAASVLPPVAMQPLRHSVQPSVSAMPAFDAAAAAPVEPTRSEPTPVDPSSIDFDDYTLADSFDSAEPSVAYIDVDDDFEISTDVGPVSLMSNETGEMVARSFGELAAAFDMANKRSLDEIAEEMLRPMLQSWLDDNLPTLVERLVREEIERVARGPRR